MTAFAWHIHHAVLLEPLTEPVSVRRAYIKANKPASEIPLRLRLLKIVQGALPVEFVQAWDAYLQAMAPGNWAAAAFDAKLAVEAAIICRIALSAYDASLDRHMPELLALHAIECPDCPWDGRTIFPDERETAQ